MAMRLKGNVTGLKSGSNPFTSPRFFFFFSTILTAMPNQRGTPVKWFQRACGDTDHKGERSVLWWPAGSAKETLMDSAHEPLWRLFLSTQNTWTVERPWCREALKSRGKTDCGLNPWVTSTKDRLSAKSRSESRRFWNFSSYRRN